jgi:hypothetical protein
MVCDPVLMPFSRKPPTGFELNRIPVVFWFCSSPLDVGDDTGFGRSTGPNTNPAEHDSSCRSAYSHSGSPSTVQRRRSRRSSFGKSVRA